MCVAISFTGSAATSMPLDLVVRRSNDEQVLVVEVVGGLGVVEAASDDDAVVDDHELVMHLAERR
jgi:hypothetical protein